MAKIEFVMSEAETLVLSMLVSEALTEVGLADGKPLRRVRTKREKELALQLDQRLAGLAGDIR